MSGAPRTTFVIASRDRVVELCAVLHRLINSTWCPIILVDNASHDDTAIAAKRIAARSGGRVTVISLPGNAGAVARNVGVAACTTPYVAFCDDDSWWAQDATCIAESVFDRYPTVALLAARTVVWPPYIEDPIVAQLAASPLGRDPRLPGPSILGFLACAAVVRKDAFEAAGGFSPILHFRGEEQLLAWDLAAQGWDLCFCSALVAYHHPSALRPPGPTERARTLRNAVLTTWLRRSPRHCLGAVGAWSCAAWHDTAHAAAALEAVAAAPAVIRARRRLPDSVERALRVLEQR